MGRERFQLVLIAAFCVPLFACSNGRRGTVPADTDASTGDASWSCEVGSYYECMGTAGCRGAAQCITGGMRLGECRCLSGPSDAGIHDAAPEIDNRVCNPGQVYTCSGTGGCSGEAMCESDGRSLGACMCPDGGVTPDASLGNGRCSNPNDQSAVNGTYAFGTVEETLSFCQLLCSFEEMPPPTCVTDCLYDSTLGAVSRDCLSCYDERSACEAQNGCPLLCLLGEADCMQQCACGAFGGTDCSAQFDTCTGIASNRCS